MHVLRRDPLRGTKTISAHTPERMVNSEAVAHTPQPHIGEAYVGIKCSISTMYRGAVPITEHQPADVLEKVCQKSQIEIWSGD